MEENTIVAEGVIGFPEMISNIEGQKQAEILLEKQGSNLRKMLKQLPGKAFSKKTVYMMTI